MLVGYWWESQKERVLRRPRRMWVDSIKMDLGERMGLVWMGLVWLRIGKIWSAVVRQ
jgi:hypothetical protein